jgi:hypothetical protein
MEMTRRKMLASAAVFAAGSAGLVACSTGPNGTPVLDPAIVAALPAAFIDSVQSLVAEGCTIGQKIQGYIPIVETIAQSVAALFGAAVVGPAILLVANAVNAVATDLCSAVPAPATPASAHFAARLRASSPATPILIGVAGSGVKAYGYRP